MLAQRAMTILLLFLFATEAVGASLLRNKAAGMETWRLLIFAAIGSATAILGRKQAATPILCLLLASMGVLLSGYPAADPSVFDMAMGPESAAFFRFVWSALRCFFGFGFFYFALTFPVESRLIRNHAWVAWLIGAAYLLFLLVTTLDLGFGVAPGLWMLTILAGLLMGLVVLIRKFFVSLTPAEKNRLRLVLIGCLAGAVPAALATISVVFLEKKDSETLELGFFMLPLFPVGLVIAVLHENVSEVSKRLQRNLTYSLAAAGGITFFFVCDWLLVLVRSEWSAFPVKPLPIAAVLALLALYPLVRWSGRYIADRFYAAEEMDSFPGPAETAFSPIMPNPYIAGNPIRSPELFFGREEDFRFIRNRLQGEQQGCIIVLRGERRTGKTSILYQILNGRLGDDFVPVFIDMQGMIVQNDAEFLSELSAAMSQAVPAGSTARDPLPKAADTYPGFGRFMDALMAGLGRRRLVLLMDEYELIEAKVNSGKLSAELFGYLDSLLIRHARLSYVFTGSKALDFSKAWLPVLARSVYREISYLARKDAEALVSAPLQGKIRFARGAVSHLLRLTNGHPFFTQALCQSLVDVLNDMRTNLVDGHSIHETVKRLLENAPPQLYYIWTTFTDPEKVVLSGLATLSKEPHSYLSAERVEKLLQSLPGEFPKSLNAPIIRMHLERLREKSMLDRDQIRYRFTMDLMRLWVQSEHNVWKVLSEAGSKVPGPGSQVDG